MAEAASAQQVHVDWRRLATDKNVAIDVARGLWEQAKASQPSDAVARSNLFRRLIDDAARNPGATQDPGKSTLVAASGPADPASLGPGKTTQVLLDQNPSPAAPQEQAGAEPARPSGAAPGQLPGAPGVDPAKPPPTAPPTVAKLRDELVAAAQASQDAVALLASAEPATIVDALRQLREGSPGLLQKVLTAAGAAIERRLGQAAPAPETQADGPPGIRVPFLGGEGDVHTHFMSDAGVPMVSTPEPVAQKVAEWRADILKREPADQQEVMPSLARATSLDMTAGDQAKQAKLGDEPAKAALPDTQRQLAATLGTVSRQVHTAAQKASTPPSPPPAAPTATALSGATAAAPGAAANANEPTTAAPSPAPTTEASAAPADSTRADPAAAAATSTSAPAPTAAPIPTAAPASAAESTPAASDASPASTAAATSPSDSPPASTAAPASSSAAPTSPTAGSAAGNATAATDDPAASSAASAAESANAAASTSPTDAAAASPVPTAASTAAGVSHATAEAVPAVSAVATAPVGPEASADADSAAPTHTPVQSKAEIASVTTAPIVQGRGEEPATLVPSPPSITIRTDSPDPIRLKDEVITLTKEYLELDKRVPEPAAAERQAKLNAIKLKFEALRVAMSKARGEDDKLVQLRVKFEKFLGVKATHEWTQGTQCVTTMSQQARLMLVEAERKITVSAADLDREIESLSVDAKNAIGKKLGTPINIGFAGAVGNTFNAVIDALTSGSLVQKCQTLINFADKVMTGELMKGAGPVFERAKANLAAVKATDPNFDLDARLEAAKGKDPKAQYKLLCSSPQFLAKMEEIKKVQNKDVDKQREAEGGPLQNTSKKSSDNTHLGGDMDTKLPQQPVENLTEPQLDFLSQQGKPAVDLTPFNSEPDPEQRRQKKVNALKSAGIHTSQAPGVMNPTTGKLEGEGAVDATSIDEDAVKATVERLTVDNRFYIEGKAENIVDPKAKWIIDANVAKAPLKAGISGTTARFVGAANLLGGTQHGAVVAMIGHLQAIEAHSFWEIVDAAGLPMQPGKYTPFAPHPTGMTSAASEFVHTQATDIALGPADAADKQKVLLGEADTK